MFAIIARYFTSRCLFPQTSLLSLRLLYLFYKHFGTYWMSLSLGWRPLYRMKSEIRINDLHKSIFPKRIQNPTSLSTHRFTSAWTPFLVAGHHFRSFYSKHQTMSCEIDPNATTTIWINGLLSRKKKILLFGSLLWRS
jgi:hypothetical protein